MHVRQDCEQIQKLRKKSELAITKWAKRKISTEIIFNRLIDKQKRQTEITNINRWINKCNGISLRITI